MKNVGIICEYNPIHTGHKHQIDLVRERGGECVICVMSGSFTQRGEPAIFDKYTRAAAAVAAGADIVLELPFPFCCASAENFARAGVSILDGACADTLSFGCECGDINILKNASSIISSERFQECYSSLQRSTKGSASAFFDAFEQVSGYKPSFGSNDLLGISYLRAIGELAPTISPFAVKREGADYNDKSIGDTHPSATALRELIKSEGLDSEALLSLIPSQSAIHFGWARDKGIAPVAGDIPFEMLCSFFRLCTPDEIRARAVALCGGEGILDDGDGILNRICDAAKKAKSNEEFYSDIFNTKYTNSRVRRVLLYSLIGVSDAFRHALPEYTTLLAASAAGREHLSYIRKSAGIRIVTKPADTPDSVSAQLHARADSLYASLMPSTQPADLFFRQSPFMM